MKFYERSSWTRMSRMKYCRIFTEYKFEKKYVLQNLKILLFKQLKDCRNWPAYKHINCPHNQFLH